MLERAAEDEGRSKKSEDYKDSNDRKHQSLKFYQENT